jgi:hypothetical protein
MYVEPILFIAPFESMAQTAIKVIAEMGIDLPVVIGSNEQAVKLAQLYPHIDVIQMLARYSIDEVCRKLAISRTSLWRKSHHCFKKV